MTGPKGQNRPPAMAYPRKRTEQTAQPALEVVSVREEVHEVTLPGELRHLLHKIPRALHRNAARDLGGPQFSDIQHHTFAGTDLGQVALPFINLNSQPAVRRWVRSDQ